MNKHANKARDFEFLIVISSSVITQLESGKTAQTFLLQLHVWRSFTTHVHQRPLSRKLRQHYSIYVYVRTPEDASPAWANAEVYNLLATPTAIVTALHDGAASRERCIYYILV